MAHQFQYSANSIVLTSEGVYEPKTEETRAAYEALLSIIQEHLDGQPLMSIVTDAADDILGVLKNDTVKISHKKKKIDEILVNPIPNHLFYQIVSIGSLITDFGTAYCRSGSLAKRLRILGEREDFLHYRRMFIARDFGIEAEMEKLPPLPPLSGPLLTFLRIQRERQDIRHRNIMRIDRALGTMESEIQN